MIRTAILVDGAFYRKRAYSLFGDKTPAQRADELEWYCKRHIREEKDKSTLYRVFYYDCPPMNKKVYHPFLKTTKDFEKTPEHKWATDFFKELTHKRNFAIDVKQKGVDMRIGIDISSLAFKKQVDRIILISGDSDFVPAAKPTITS